MLENTPIKTPPDRKIVAPIISHIQLLYKEIYAIGNQIPKRDKLGLHANIEKICINMLSKSIQASLKDREIKQQTLKELRIEIEILKHLIRIEFELNIIKEKSYLSIQEKLQEISKEAVGWEKYANKNSPQGELL